MKKPAVAVYEKRRRMDTNLPVAAIDPNAAGVFETLRAYDGKIFALTEHLERLRESARTVGVRLPSEAVIRRDVLGAVEAYTAEFGRLQSLMVRLTVSQARCYVFIGPGRPSSALPRAAVLRTTAVTRSLANAAAPEVKTAAYQNALFAEIERGRGRHFEDLFVDTEGYVTEVKTGNIFAVRPGPVLGTPPGPGILRGVTRRYVIKCARQAGIPLQEVPLTRHDIYNAAEVFLTNTSWEILPVAEVDGRRIGKRVPGPWTLKLHRLFKQKVVSTCRKPHRAR